jgi:hypothetical protein
MRLCGMFASGEYLHMLFLLRPQCNNATYLRRVIIAASGKNVETNQRFHLLSCWK